MINEIRKYYSKAKRVALLAQDNLTKKWFHIFSVIELLPDEIPDYNIPTKDWYNNKIIRSKLSSNTDNYSFYLIVNDINSIDDAISMFNYPFQHNTIDGEENIFFNNQFTKEPSGSTPLVLPSNIYDDEVLASILPKRHSGLFAWSQIDFKRDVQNLFNGESISKEMKAMSQLTLEWLGFDIWSKSEHIGNIYLTAPNPYFRDIDVSLSQNPIGIFYNIKHRKGIEEEFILRVIDNHGDNLALDKAFKINKPAGLIELPHQPHLLELRIYNSNENLIAIQKPATFINSIHLGMSMKQADFHVKVQDDNGIKEFVVEKFSKERPSIIGTPSEFNAPYFFKTAESKRKHITHKKNKEFIFFSGGKSSSEKTNLKTKSKEIIREIINNSKETCYLCDPYFSAKDLIDYAFYIKNTNVDLRILNSKEFVSKDMAKTLLDAINEYNSKPFQKIECRILQGRSILHDRFIISDKNVWYLGSSFNEFGNRATCIAKVPESSNIQILKEIEKWFFGQDYTLAIDEYVNNQDDE